MSKVALSEADLLKIANNELKDFPGYIEGMQFMEARMEKHILVLGGECFFDSDHNPTDKTVRALEIYQEFSKEFTERYTLSA